MPGERIRPGVLFGDTHLHTAVSVDACNVEWGRKDAFRFARGEEVTATGGRIIEIPTPRWTAYEAKRFKVTMSADVPMTTQERAYTSPIWDTP